MIEKVNPMHPDKIADRIAGSLVDMACAQGEWHRSAVEVLIGHGQCYIINETTATLKPEGVKESVFRIAGRRDIDVIYKEYKQDPILSQNQEEEIRCGDNGIFKGVPLSEEQKLLSMIARTLYKAFPTDGKYILDGASLIICQSCADKEEILEVLDPVLAYREFDVKINPLGPWTGGIDVDTGATNRKLGSDMADSVTGGGLHGKDLSKADVSANIYAFRLANERKRVVEYSCAIGSKYIFDSLYSSIVDSTRHYIDEKGGFEKLAEWGLW